LVATAWIFGGRFPDIFQVLLLRDTAVKWAIILSLPIVGASLWILHDRVWQKPALLAEGVYKTCEEVSAFSGETLELREGQFRYWFYSDVHTGKEPAYPLSGAFRIKGNTLVLEHPDVPDNVRQVDILNGVPILWRDDGFAYWQN
jgi:hypothetical protein